MSNEAPEPVFREFGGEEDAEPEVTEIESLCMNCHANGNTRILLTRIPYYKNVVVMSFACEECGYQNNEIQPGGAYAEMGVIWTLKVECAEDLNRQVVKSDHTSVKIPELDFEIPAKSQSGEVTTVEGILSRAIRGLSQDQVSRRQEHPYEASQIQEFIEKLTALQNGQVPWTLELTDVTGNTFLENPAAPRLDPRASRLQFERSEIQDHALGIYNHRYYEEADDGNSDDSAEYNIEPKENGKVSPAGLARDLRRAVFPAPPDTSARVARPSFAVRRARAARAARPDQPDQPDRADHLLGPADPGAMPYDQLVSDEVMVFRTNCPDCDSPCETNMKMTDIPHFKEVVIMSTTCEFCGHRTNEVKSGGGIEDKGVRFELRIASKDDFSRDVLKSETCSMEIPELDLEVGGRALGGRFTTAEGLISATAAQLRDCPGAIGDAPGVNRYRLDNFVSRVEEVLRGERAVTVILDDPAGNSYVQSLADDPNVPDDGLKVTRYERTFQQNDELGINDMKTDNYQPAPDTASASVPVPAEPVPAEPVPAGPAPPEA